MSLAKSLPRVREFNTKPPTVWDWNLVAQKVNRLSDNEGATSGSVSANINLTGDDGQLLQIVAGGGLAVGWGRMKTIA